MSPRFTLSYLLAIALAAVVQFGEAKASEDPLELSQKDQKELVKQIGSLLEANYLFPETAAEIADYLQGRLEDGSYVEISNPDSFARRITFDLRHVNHDEHLALVYDPQWVKDSRTEASKSSEHELKELEQRRFEKQRRDNFGFHKVEILDGNVGYLDLRFFRSTDFAASAAVGAMAFLCNSDAVIIDLRNNLGGGASMYLFLISYFFDSDMVHLSDLINRRAGSIQQFWTLPYVPGTRLPNVDLYILTSKRTFSAAEQFTYDLQSLKRALVVGQSTGGGAHIATRLVVDENFYIFVPFAGSKNPRTNTDWEGTGVKPDVEVPEEDALETAHLLALKKLRGETKDEAWKKKLSMAIDTITSGKKE